MDACACKEDCTEEAGARVQTVVELLRHLASDLRSRGFPGPHRAGARRSLERHTHRGAGIAAAGNQIVTTVLITYAIDCYPEEAGSIGVFITLVRQTWGFIGPFW